MEIKIQGSSNFTVTDSIKDYIEKRIEKLNYFKSHIDKISFHLENEKLLSKAEATLSIKKFGLYKFEATAEEMYSAIDKIIHKMDIKISREKTRIQDHSNISHEEVNERLTKKDEEESKPVKSIDVSKKPTALTDAYLQLGVEESTIFGFNLITDDNIIAPAFLRKVEDDVAYLYKQNKEDSYSEVMLKKSKQEIKEGKKVREISLKKMSLPDAQNDILNQDFHYNIYIDTSSNKVSFLFKEDNGKWILVS